MKLQYQELPQEFVQMLTAQTALFNTVNPMAELQTTNKALYLVLENSFKEFAQGKVNMEKIFASLGWFHFRDRLCSVFLSKVLFKKYPNSTDINLIDDIKNFEKKFSFIGVTSNSRLMLLGFFLKLNSLELGVDDIKSGEETSMHNPPKGFEQILEMAKVNTDKPDWIILLCWYLVEYLGFYRVQASILQGKKFREMLSELSEKQRTSLMQNLFAYGASINEHEWFDASLV